MKLSLSGLFTGVAVAASALVLQLAPASAATLAFNSTVSVGFPILGQFLVASPVSTSAPPGSLLFNPGNPTVGAIGTIPVVSGFSGSFLGTTGGSAQSLALGQVPATPFLTFTGTAVGTVDFFLTSPLIITFDPPAGTTQSFTAQAFGNFVNAGDVTPGFGSFGGSFNTAFFTAQGNFPGNVTGNLTAVPEPAPVAGILGLGVAGAIVLFRRRQIKNLSV